MQLTRETSERLTAGMARLVRTDEHLGHRVAADARPLTTLLEKLADGLDRAGRRNPARAPAVAG